MKPSVAMKTGVAIKTAAVSLLKRLAPSLLVAAIALVALPAQALPRFTLEAGSRCSNCHVNPQGGGLRSNSGWYMMNTTTAGMVTWDKVGLKSVNEAESNTFFNGKLTLGGDLRIQEARMGHPTADAPGLPDRMWVPMQMTPAAELKVASTVSVTASANLAGIYYQSVMNSPIYPGQSNFDGWIRWTPQRDVSAVAEAPPAEATPAAGADDDFDAPPATAPAAAEPPVGLPSVRVGMLEPSFGIRHDDHTLLIHGRAENMKGPVLPAFYNDVGGEVNWEGLHWLSIDAGAFWPRNFSEARFGTATSGVAARNRTDAAGKPLGSARVTFWPRIDSIGVNMWAGGSTMYTPNFLIEGGHFGIGKTYWGSLFLEGTHSRDEILAVSRYAWMVQADYPIQPWLTLEARYESSHSTADATPIAAPKLTDVQAVVAGIQWLPFPMIELRPEWRYVNTADYSMAQYTLQIHLFY